MSDAQSQRNVPKRQIARLIGSSVFPMWVLSEDSQLVFTNEAFDALFGELGPEPLGLRCVLDAQEPSAERTVLARWLALPANAPSSWVRCVRDKLPDRHPDRESVTDNTLQPLAGEPLLRWILPLDETSEPCYLCILKPDRGDAQAILEGDFHQRIEVPALSIWQSDANLDGVWFLQGQSLASETLRKQLRLAIGGDHPLRLVGHPGNYLVFLAGLLFQERRSHRGLPATRTAPFTIDCSLMDKDLLQSTLEWIDDTRRKNIVPEVIFHRLDMLPGELREPLARICREQGWKYLATAEQQSQDMIAQGGEDWEWLISTSSVQVLRIEPLSHRTQELESLLFAWMRRTKHVRWTPAFLDGLLAYSWPGDIDELDRALEHALGVSSDGMLDESHLPISLRTYPSHIERPPKQESIELDQVLERLERMLIERALESHPRNNTAAAKSLGISRTRLLRRMQQWGIGSAPAASPAEDEVIFEEFDTNQGTENSQDR